MIRSPVQQLRHVSGNQIAPRVLVRTEDEVIRIVSPVTGHPITMMLPFIETDSLRGLSYSSQLSMWFSSQHMSSHLIDRLYLLRKQGDIWVISTKFNPCKLVDIWNSGDIGTRHMLNISQLTSERKRHDALHFWWNLPILECAHWIWQGRRIHISPWGYREWASDSVWQWRIYRDSEPGIHSLRPLISFDRCTTAE